MVDDFVKTFNGRREEMFTPSTIICVKKYISFWYDIGEELINSRFKMYVSINFKLESGYYIQDAVSGKLVIMMQTSLVKMWYRKKLMDFEKIKIDYYMGIKCYWG